MKKSLIIALALVAGLTATAQTPYQKKYSNSNQPSVQGTLNDQNRRTGSWTWWYLNGKISQEGSYNNGEKTGVWTLYYEDGSRMAEEC